MKQLAVIFYTVLSLAVSQWVYAEPIINSGSLQANCNPGYVPKPIKFENTAKPAGTATFSVLNLELAAVEDNINIEFPVGGEAECSRLTGYDIETLFGFAVELQEGSFQLDESRKWYGNFFDIGNGLALKLSVADSGSKKHEAVTERNPKITTFIKRGIISVDNSITKLGLSVKAELKVIGEVKSGVLTKVEIGRFDYRLEKLLGSGNVIIARAPIYFEVMVKQAAVRGCRLDSPNQTYTLPSVSEQELDSLSEVGGYNLDLNLTCDKNVSVKASFFDNYSEIAGVKDYLQTRYTDSTNLSQYVFKVKDSLSGQQINFLPVADMPAGEWGVPETATTYAFTEQPTQTDNEPVSRSYTVSYIKRNIPNARDEPGKIKGMMTVQFLYQ